MPQITGLNDFPSGQPVDPALLNQNFDIVESAFNTSAVRTDNAATQTLAGPLAARIVDRGGTVYSIERWATTATPPADLRNAIRTAIQEIHDAGGGVLYFPAGTYVWDCGGYPPGVPLLSGVTVRGAGPGATIFRRPDTGTGPGFLTLNGPTNVAVEGITFDFRGAVAFFSAIFARGEPWTDVRILDCEFKDTNETLGTPNDRPDRWAVSLANEVAGPSGYQHRRVWIERCTANNGIQLTANMGTGVRGLWITDCVITEAEQNAISILSTSGGVEAVVEDIWITNCSIIRPRNIGIAIGPDRPAPDNYTARFRNIHVRGVSIRGTTGRSFSHGIFIRAGKLENRAFTLEDIYVEGDSLAPEYRALTIVDDIGDNIADNVEPPAFFEQFAIRSFRTWKGERSASIRNLRDSVIQDLEVRDASGLELNAGCANVDVVGYRQIGGGTGIVVTECGPVRIERANVRNTTGTNSAGLTCVSNDAARPVRVTSRHSVFTDDRATGKTQDFGIFWFGAGAFPCRHEFDELVGNELAPTSNVPATALRECYGASTPALAFAAFLTGSASMAGTAVPAGAAVTFTVPVVGATSDHPVIGFTHSNLLNAVWDVTARVSSPGNVEVRIENRSAAAASFSNAEGRVFLGVRRT